MEIAAYLKVSYNKLLHAEKLLAAPQLFGEQGVIFLETLVPMRERDV